MFAWKFPVHAPFDIWLGNGRIIVGCTLVEADEDSFTVDFDVMESFGRMVRTRGQFRLDMLIHVASRVPIQASPPQGNKVGTGQPAPGWGGP